MLTIKYKREIRTKKDYQIYEKDNCNLSAEKKTCKEDYGLK